MELLWFILIGLAASRLAGQFSMQVRQLHHRYGRRAAVALAPASSES
jgi:hypothetical protein